MRTSLAAAVLAAAMSFAGPAHAVSPALSGLTCGFVGFTDAFGVFANPGVVVGELWGGPVADDDAQPVASVTVSCKALQGGTGLHTQAAAGGNTTTGWGPLVAVAPPVTAVLADVTGPQVPVWACTQISSTNAVGTTRTLYFDAPSGTFMTDPAAAQCAVATSQAIPPDLVCDASPIGCTIPGCTFVTCRLPEDTRVVVPTPFVLV